MADGSILIRCPGCGNANAVPMAVGQQLQCRVCQTVFFAPVIDPEQLAATVASPPPVSEPSANPSAARVDHARVTREHVPTAPSAPRPPTAATPSRGWRTEECVPTKGAQTPAAAARDNVRSSSAQAETASPISAGDEPVGGRVWTVITVIASLLIVTTSLLAGVLWLRDRQPAASSPAEKLPGSATTPTQAAPSASHTPAHWSDAVLHAQRLGLLEVKIARVKYGAVRAKDVNNEVITTDDTSLLAITVSVHNRGTAACAFRSWYAGGFESADGQELLPELSDDLERTYSLLRFDDVSSIEGQRMADAIEPRQLVQDTVVFLVPADFDRTTIRFFRLTLPAHAIGTEDFFRFEIPVRMIDGFSGGAAGTEAGTEVGAEVGAEVGTGAK